MNKNVKGLGLVLMTVFALVGCANGGVGSESVSTNKVSDTVEEKTVTKTEVDENGNEVNVENIQTIEDGELKGEVEVIATTGDDEEESKSEDAKEDDKEESKSEDDKEESKEESKSEDKTGGQQASADEDGEVTVKYYDENGKVKGEETLSAEEYNKTLQ